ncbi:MAG TPA: hypothetical protein VNZ22_00220, partial [Bacillota bacterium]|nr:hypothetical protein [Bacillota bacterium]
MAEPDHPAYERLTRAYPRSGFAVAVAARSSLWLGPDHLLCIETTGYTETYKRFYFRDIQAVLIRQTKRQRNWTLAFGGLSLLFTIIAIVP